MCFELNFETLQPKLQFFSNSGSDWKTSANKLSSTIVKFFEQGLDDELEKIRFELKLNRLTIAVPHRTTLALLGAERKPSVRVTATARK